MNLKVTQTFKNNFRAFQAGNTPLHSLVLLCDCVRFIKWHEYWINLNYICQAFIHHELVCGRRS